MQRKGFNFKTRRLKRSLFRKIIPLLGIALISFGVYKFFTTLFLVKTIKIAGEQEEVLKGIEKLGGQNLLFLSKEKWEKRIEKENPLLKEIKIERKFPNQILLKFKKREPKAVIFNPIASTRLLIDGEGVILKKENQEKKLPVIIAGLQNFEIGDRIKNKSIELILDCIEVLEESAQGARFEVSEGAKILTVTLSNNVLILISQELEKEKIIYSLQILLKKFKIEGKWPKRIDLRFKKPILTF